MSKCMQIILSNNLNFFDVVAALKDGKTIVYPTETCYGLGCDARNVEAVEKVAKIKQRQANKPMLVVVPDAAMALRYLEWSLKLQELADKYWFIRRSPPKADEVEPGALTVVGKALSLRGVAEATTKQSTLFRRLLDCFVARAPRNDSLAPGVVASDGTVAFRVTSHPIAARLSRELDAPLVSTSANISGEEQPYSVEAVQRYFASQSDQPDIIIDAGELPRRAPSTIVRVIGDRVEVLRQGEVVVINF